MEAYKVKSLTPELSDFDIKNGCHTITFISFERCLELFKKECKNDYNKELKVKGYRVTNEGIEVILD